MPDPVWTDGVTPLNSVNMTKLQTRDEKGVSNGYASLDGTTKVPLAQLPPYPTGIPAVVNGQWLKGSGGAAVWAPITPQDVANVPYGTSLPASPYDGQEAILVDSVTNPSYSWRLRWNAGSTYAYKWEYVGGRTFIAQDDSNIGISGGGTWGTIGTTPQFVIPRNGDYLFEAQVTGNSPVSTGVNVQLGIANASVGAAPLAGAMTGGNYCMYYDTMSVALIAPIGAGQTVRLTALTSIANMVVYGRVLKVAPQRLS